MKELDIVFNIDYKNNSDIAPLFLDIPKYIEFIQVNNIEQFKRLINTIEDDTICYIWVHPSFSSKRVEKGYQSKVMTESVPLLEAMNIEYSLITRSTGKTSEKGYYDVASMLDQKGNGKKSYSAKKMKEILKKNEENRKDNNVKNDEIPLVVILTAIKEEYNSIRLQLNQSSIKDCSINDTSYESGIFNWNKINIAKVIIRECGAKNNIAAQETERAIQYFKPSCILFVGIAGSRKPNDFKIGDVLIANKIYSYEAGKADKDMFYARPDQGFITYALTEKAKSIRNGDEWKDLLKGNYVNDCKADLGIIASGEQLIEHFNSQVGEIINQYYNDTSAIEMEGFGFSQAVNRQGRETSNIVVGVIRGISDIINRDDKVKLNVNNEDRRPESSKELASNAASAFAFALILELNLKNNLTS